MKYPMIGIALLAILYSCQKEVTPTEKVYPEVGCFTANLPHLSLSRVNAIKAAREQRKKKPPVDTFVVTPPPPTTPPPPPTGTVPEAMILLDFDGAYVSGTSWNSGGPLYLESSGLSAAQQQAILDSVRLDYRQWPRLYVGTDSALYSKVNPRKRMRLILTDSWEWYGRAGGVAFTGSFTWGDNTPCFVFTGLHNYNLKNIQEASSHELGHTFGLRHIARFVDGIKVEDYHSGDGLTAPIMGVAYYRPIGEWVIGLNSFGATQNDTLLIGNHVR